MAYFEIIVAEGKGRTRMTLWGWALVIGGVVIVAIIYGMIWDRDRNSANLLEFLADLFTSLF